MFAHNYQPKHAINDLLIVLAYRVNDPTAPVAVELTDAEARLRDLTGVEMLGVMVDALKSGVSRTVQRAPIVSADTAPSAAAKSRRTLGRTWGNY